MSFLINPYGFGGGGGNLPTRSLDFERSSSQYLSMSDANFGAFDKAKFAISVWVKRESTGSNHTIMSQLTGVDRCFWLVFEDDSISWDTFKANATFEGSITTTATYTSTSSWYHILVWYDSANATAGDRMRLWVNGSEVTSFAYDLNPTAAANNSTAAVNIGAYGSGSDLFDGLIYQLGFFSGTLPAIGDVYDSGSPKDISGLTGLWSYLDCAGNDPTSDGVLATDWTNNNSVTTSTAIP